MTAFRYDQLSQHSTVQAITRRLGLLGLGRLLKILEECTDNGRVALSESDWLAVLDCTRDQFAELLGVLAEVRAFSASQAEGLSAPLMLTLGQSLQFLLAVPDPATVIYTEARQWSAWMTVELAAPGWLVNDPASQELFRRWCASNVSLAEMQQAAELAALAHDLSPVGLHERFKAIRAARVAQAYHRA